MFSVLLAIKNFSFHIEYIMEHRDEIKVQNVLMNGVNILVSEEMFFFVYTWPYFFLAAGLICLPTSLWIL